MLTPVIYVTLLVTISSSASPPPSALRELPLTPQDVLAVQASPSSPSLPSYTENSTCLLLPAPKDTKVCTWHTREQCLRQPRVITSTVFRPDCQEEGGLRLADCQEETKEQPLVHTVQVCSIVADKQCQGPCFNCPTFCQATQQGWCENGHVIKTEVSSEKKEGGVEVRVERDVVTTTRNCYTKKVEELCANVNCKFVNPREECKQRNSSTVVRLQERRCEICQGRQDERVSVEEQCRPVNTRDCGEEPLDRPWRKLCSPLASLLPGNSLEPLQEVNRVGVVSIQERGGRENGVSIQDLISSSISSPVEDLLVRALGKIQIQDLESYKRPVVVIPNSWQESLGRLASVEEHLANSEEQLVEEELQLVRSLQAQAAQPTKINMNVKYEFLAPTATTSTEATSTRATNSVYFDQLLLTHLQEATTEAGASHDSPLLLNYRTSGSLPTTTDNPTTATTTTSTTTTSTTTSTTTTTTTTTTPTPAKANMAGPSRKLSSAELLTLCFTSGLGCDFSQNEIVFEEEIQEAPTTTTTTTTRRPEVSAETRARLKQRLMLCFFQGICSDDDVPSSAPPTTTTQRPTTTTPKPVSRSEEINQRIRDRARRCFFQGIC